MTMKTIAKILSATLLISGLIFSTQINAQGKRATVAKKRHAAAVAHKAAVNHKVNMVQAHKFLKRTNFVIIKAHKAVKTNHVYTGDLAKAVAHQKVARKYLLAHKPYMAVMHSAKARKHAFRALAANKGNVDKSFQVNAEEKGLLGNDVSDADLEKELGTTTFDDKNVTDKELSEIEVLEMDPSEYKNE